MSEYKVQINVKVGDHLINIQGDTVAEAQEYLHQLAENSGAIHAAMEILDGRPATEIVQKEKTWGARSQSGRTYPRTTSQVAPAQTAVSPSSTSTVATPSSSEQLLKDELGATVVSTSTNPPSPSSTPTHVPDSNPELCAQHGLKRKFYEGGTNKNTNKEFSASWRCPATGCKPLWQKSDGSFQ